MKLIDAYKTERKLTLEIETTSIQYEVLAVTKKNSAFYLIQLIKKLDLKRYN